MTNEWVVVDVKNQKIKNNNNKKKPSECRSACSPWARLLACGVREGWPRPFMVARARVGSDGQSRPGRQLAFLMPPRRGII